MRDNRHRLRTIALALACAAVSVGAQDNPKAPDVRPPRLAPIWKIALPGTQVDTLEMLPADRVLVGSVLEGTDSVLGMKVYTQRYLDLSLLRASTGEPLWNYTRDTNIYSF